MIRRLIWTVELSYEIGIYDTILNEDFGLFFLMLSGSILLRHLAQFYCAIYSILATLASAHIKESF